MAAFPGDDGRIFFSRFENLESMEPDGSDIADVTAPSRYDSCPDVSADGRRVVFHRYDLATQAVRGIFVKSLRTGVVRRVPGTGPGDVCPSFSPDGQTIVFQRYDTDSDVSVLHTVHLDGSRTRWFPATWGARNPSFAPDGKTILFVLDSYLQRMRVDGTHMHRVPNSSGAFSADFSPDGRRIAVVLYGANLYVLRLRDHRLHQLTSDAWQARAVAFSPSGRRIAFTRTDTETGNGDRAGTWVIGANGSHEHRISDDFLLSLDWQPLPR